MLRRAFATSKMNTTTIDYYSVLGLKSYANEDQIKKSFYELAKKYHPDSTEMLTPIV